MKIYQKCEFKGNKCKYERCGFDNLGECDKRNLFLTKQKCEELEQDTENWAYKAGLAICRASRYLRALEEIGGLIQSTLDDFEEDDEEVQLSYCHNISLQILDIISKAKAITT